MYCSNGKCYLPQPPRDWSRVQNSCSLITASTVDQFVQVPYTGEIVPYAELGPRLAMINKGNVLQYKKNSSNLTSWQKYSQIAKGQWTNRTKTWATQSSRGYTNPNNLSLIRSGGTNVTLGGVPTALPVTCPKIPINNNPVLPTNGGGGTSEPPLPPPPPQPSEGGGTVIPIVPVPIVQPIVIQDFGNLVCGSYQNLCTGEIIEPIKLDNCHPTTDSDVPGPIQELCWNDGNPTWYPRQRYIMTNSTNKWPVNAVLGSAVKPSTPILIAVVIDCNIVNLSWSFDFECLPISRFNIYQDGQLIANIDGTLRSYTITINTSGTYNFSITGENNGIISDISNVVEITIIEFIQPTISGLTYMLYITGNVYTYKFISGTGTITFNSEITNAEILVVGPGGNGGPGDTVQSPDDGPGGGGGAGGQIIYQSNILFTTNQTCDVVVGTNPNSSEFDTYVAVQGANGVIINGGLGVNGGGSGGQGGNNGAATPGSPGTQYSIGSIVNTYYSGGGGGGSIGPGGGLIGANGGNRGGGKGSDSGVQLGNCEPGEPNTGGGGGGSSSTDDPNPIPGCPGGSGVVILSFQICGNNISNSSQSLLSEPQSLLSEPLMMSSTTQLETTTQPKLIKKIAPSSTPKPRITSSQVNTTSNTNIINPPNFNIIDTIPEIGYFEMPPFLNNFDKLVIFNKTSSMLPVKSEYKIFNLLYYRDGEYDILLPPNSHTDFIYVKQDNNIVINASII